MAKNVINLIMRKSKKTLILGLIIALAFNINFVYAVNPQESMQESTQESTTGTSANSNTTVNTPAVNTTTENKTDENKTTEKPVTQTNSNEKTTTVNKQEQVKPATKSSNADLFNLGITPNDFSGFVASKTSYSVSVPNTVKTVEVYAKAKDSKAKITGTGKIELKEGTNSASVTVTAEDGTKKTYTITITRLKEGEKVNTSSNSATGSEATLQSLQIEGFNLEPKFEPEKYAYTINFEGEQDKLNIIAKGNSSSDIIQIIGNEYLVDGTNVIMVMVSDSKEKKTSLYQITVNKNIEKQKAIQKEIDDSINSYKIKTWIIRILVLTIIIGLILIIILKHKRDVAREEDEELPKSLRRKEIKKKIKPKKENISNKEKNDKKERKSKGKHGR